MLRTASAGLLSSKTCYALPFTHSGLGESLAMKVSFFQTKIASYYPLTSNDSDTQLAVEDLEKSLEHQQDLGEKWKSWLKPMLVGALIAVLITIPLIYALMVSRRADPDHLYQSMVPRCEPTLNPLTSYL